MHAWKACVPKGTGGSNPPPSATSEIRAKVGKIKVKLIVFRRGAAETAQGSSPVGSALRKSRANRDSYSISRQLSLVSEPLKLSSFQSHRLAATGLWLVYNSQKPELFAKVQVTPKVLKITNGNHTAWNSPTIILNAAGPILNVAGVWVPNETRELALSGFPGSIQSPALQSRV